MEPEVSGGPAEVNDAAAAPQVDSQPTDSGSGGESLNPAWSPLLDKLPSEFVPMVTPTLREWDQKFQTQLQQVQSQYEPYKSLVDNKVDPQVIESAYGLYQLMNENPQLVYQQMAEYYGFGADGQGQGQSNENNGAPEVEEFDFNAPDADITQHPKFQELLQNQQALAQIIVGEQEQKQQQALEAQIDSELATVKEANPDLDELMILRLATANQISITEAAQQLQQYNEQILTASRTPAPQVFRQGGGVPAAQQPDPAKMDSKSTKKLVADILAAQAQG